MTLRNIKSPFTKVIATHYYDGPMEGFIEHREWDEACVFQLLDWDREADLRVYEIAKLPGISFEEIVAALFDQKLPTWPIWVLPRASRTRAEAMVDKAFPQARPIATVTTRDLFDTIADWDPAPEMAKSSGSLVAPGKRRLDAG